MLHGVPLACQSCSGTKLEDYMMRPAKAHLEADALATKVSTSPVVRVALQINLAARLAIQNRALSKACADKPIECICMQVFSKCAQVRDTVGLANCGISSSVAKDMHKKQGIYGTAAMA